MDKKYSSGTIFAISTSKQKGQKKKNVPMAEFKKDHGIVGDVHADGGNRQISLLANEPIERVQEQGFNVNPGDFAENITTQGIDLSHLTPGTHLKLGDQVILEITKIGKECHNRCAIYYQTGDCIMPKEGVFAKILEGGVLKVGDSICVHLCVVN